ncbi:MAG TPA: YtzI protein [Bacillota bacterium]|nr:YtzI protein [Bacillota bacterium]
MGTMIASLIFTLVVLLLTILTITKGYGYKHTIDPVDEEESVEEYKRQ